MVSVADSGQPQGFSAQHKVKAQLGKYFVTKKLGAGFSATIRLAHTEDGTSYALKIFDRSKAENDDKFLQLVDEEVGATLELKHKNIVKYFEFEKDAEYVKSDGSKKKVAYIAQEPIMGGELFAHIYHTGIFEEAQCRYFFKQILSGIGFMHRAGFSHRDLKPENIVLDHNFDCKVVDFGFAAPLEGRDGSGFQRTFRGTLAYMAPEILNREAYQGDSVDLFALGCILFVMRSGAMPFDKTAQSNDEIYKFFAINRVDKYWATHEQGKEPGYFSAEFKDLISQLLHYTPQHRPMLADIIAHPWLQGPTATNAEIKQEFQNRLNIVNNRVQEEFLEEKRQARARRGAFEYGNKLYVYGDLTQGE